MKRIRQKEHGFTLIEALLGSLILAAGALVIGALTHRCTQNTVRGWEYEQAYRLLDECLDTFVAGMDKSLLQKGRIEGDFAGRYPNYEYSIEAVPASGQGQFAADLYKVTATVSWRVSSQRYKVQATTLMHTHRV